MTTYVTFLDESATDPVLIADRQTGRDLVVTGRPRGATAFVQVRRSPITPPDRSPPPA